MRQLVTDVPLAGSPFPPIADYAFLSDCETCALVAASGNVEWMCLPRMDGPSVFGAMLDRDAGFFRCRPRRHAGAGRTALHPGNQRPGDHLGHEDRLGDRARRAAHRPLAPRRRSLPHPPPLPTDHDAEHVLLRTLRCVNGSVEIVMECEPVLDYGRERVAWEYDGEGYHAATARGPHSDLTLRLHTDLNVGFEGSRARARTTMHDGDLAFVALGWSEHGCPTTWEEAYERLRSTADFWHDWLAHGDFPDHPWRTYLQRSALTLKGLTYAPTGAMVAAPTTSLPEAPGGRRNWDYRFTWIRDSTFMLWGLYSLGFDWEADDFFFFIADVAGDEEKLQVMYGIDGERRLTESTLDHLGGYDGARPVRVGNGAHEHRQHDVWGALLDSFYLHTRSRDRLADTMWPILRRQVEDALAHWREPDRGIWEVRGEPKHFTSSKMFCWVAADRGARLAVLREEHERAQRWAAAADEIRADVLEHGVDERGVLVQHYDTTALDASLLLVPLVRFLAPDDPIVRATVLAIGEELTEDGLVLRYRPEETDDGFAGAQEGTFAICSFWMVSALVEIGETQRARDLCEKMLGYASPLLLFAEEIEARSGRHLGNFPQAFTHLALINAVMHVVRADEALQERSPILEDMQGTGGADRS